MDYFWSLKDGVPIEDFLKKARPSIVDTDDTPWIWVSNDSGEKKDPEREQQHGAALVKAQKTLAWLEKRINEIETDESVPIRAKKGTQSKKQVRDEAHETAKEDLKEISTDAGWTTGKWMLFPRHADVDRIWSKVALSLVKGRLKESGATLAKVAPTQAEGDESSNHLICVYLDNVYDEKSVAKVLEALLKDGIEPSACKPDLYTLAGIDSNHPTKLRSSLWRPAEVIKGGAAEVKKLLEWARTSKVGDDGMIGSDSEDERIEKGGKRRLDTGQEETRVAAAQVQDKDKSKDGPSVQHEGPKVPVTKKVKRHNQSAAQRYAENDIFGGGSDSSDEG